MPIHSNPRKTAGSISGVVALIVLSLLMTAAPAQSQEIRPEFWGMHSRDFTKPVGVSIGSANLTTTLTWWKNVEVSDNEFDFTRMHQQILAAEQGGAVKPMLILGGTPRFHSSRPRSTSFAAYMPSVSAWRRYVGAVVQRYGDRIDYQIWPEPNVAHNWSGTPAQMARLTAEASKVIKREAPSAKVVSGAVALRLRSQRNWTTQFFRQRVDGKRVHKYIDVVAIDPFPDLRGTPEDSFALIRDVRRSLARLKVRKPIWNNEINYGVQGGNQDTPVRYGPSKQRSFVLRTHALNAAAKMGRVYWLGWYNSPALGINMVGGDGSPTAAADAYRIARSWMAGTNYRGCKVRRGFWSCTATTSRELRRIMWSVKGRTTVKRPRRTLRLESQNGRSNMPKRRFRVGSSPVMLAVRR